MKEMISSFHDILNSLGDYGINFTDIPAHIVQNASDIHFSAGAPVRIYCSDGKCFCAAEVITSDRYIEDLFYRLCDYSLYRHQGEISKGFLTVFGKYRCGVSGTAVRRNGKIIGMKNISSLNIRIPRIVPGVSQSVAGCKAELLDGVLVVGPPSSGKTTVLRDIIHRLKDERCVVVDERRELIWGSTEQSADVMLDFGKEEAISRAIRNLSPAVIVCDELSEEDIPVIERIVSAGVVLIASVHADPDAWQRRPAVKELIRTGAFGRIAVLEGRDKPGKVRKVVKIGELYKTSRDRLDRALWDIHESVEV